jgi:hypothetical protein
MREVLSGLLLICAYIASSNMQGDTDFEYVVFLCTTLREAIRNILDR